MLATKLGVTQVEILQLADTIVSCYQMGHNSRLSPLVFLTQ